MNYRSLIKIASIAVILFLLAGNFAGFSDVAKSNDFKSSNLRVVPTASSRSGIHEDALSPSASVQVLGSINVGLPINKTAVDPTFSGIAVDTATGSIYLTDYNNHVVYVFNLSTKSYIKSIAVSAFPGAITYDSSNGNLYVSTFTGLDIINGLTGSYSSSIAIPNGTNNVIYDPVNNLIYASQYGFSNTNDTLYVFNPLNNSITASIGIPHGINQGGTSIGLTLNPSNGNIYLSSGATIYVVDDLTNKISYHVNVNSLPSGTSSEAYDPLNNNLYLATGTSGPYSLVDLNLTSNVTGNITTPSDTTALVYDSYSNLVYAVLNSVIVSVVNCTRNIVVQNITTRVNSNAIIFDASNGVLYLASPGNIDPMILELNGKITSFGTRFPVPNGEGIVYDPSNGNLYASTGGGVDNYNVTVVNPVTHAILTKIYLGNLGSGYGPGAIAYDPANGYIYAVDGNKLFEINGNGNANTVIASWTSSSSFVPVTTDLMYNSYNGYIYGDTVSGVFILDPNSGLIHTVSTGNSPTGIAVDSNNGNVYAANSAGSNITVISGTNNSTIVTIPVNYGSNGITYDSSNGNLYVTYTSTPVVTVINANTGRYLYAIPVGSPYGNIALEGIIYDASNGNLYSRVSSADTMIVINASSGRSIGSISYGPYSYFSGSLETFTLDATNGLIYAVQNGTNIAAFNPDTIMFPNNEYVLQFEQGGMAIDPLTGYIFQANTASNNVTVINPATDHTVASVFANPGPQQIAYDSANGNMYVSGVFYEVAGINWAGVAVINASTYALVDTIPLAFNSRPGPITYDAANGNLYVANTAGSSVYVINGNTDTATGSITVGSYPQGLFYDYTNGNLYATSGGHDSSGVTQNLSLINTATNKVQASIILGRNPSSGMAYDDVTGNLYIANSNANNVSVVDLSTFSIIKSINVGVNPVQVSFDSHDGLIFSVNKGSDNVSLINTKTNVIYGSINLGTSTGGFGPTHILYDPVNDNTYIVDPGTNVITEIGITYTVTFTETGLPSGISWYVNTTGHNSGALTGTTYFLKLTNGTYSYTVSTTNKQYMATGGTFTIAGASKSFNITFSEVTYPVTFTETGLPSGSTWYINVTGQTSLSSTTSTITANLANGTYTYSVATSDHRYAAQGGAFKVNGAGLSIPVSFKGAYYVSFSDFNLPFGTEWFVNITGGNSYSTTFGAVSFQLSNGTYSYHIATVYKNYKPTVPTGTITVSGHDQNLSVTFVSVNYTVTFTESGLPVGTSWSVTLGGILHSSTSNSISFGEQNGTYSYNVTIIKGYTSSLSSGTIRVKGANQNNAVNFSVRVSKYSLTFTETGLPSGTAWYVNITGQASQMSTGATITLKLQNGSYTYSIASSNRNYAPAAYPGTFNIAGSTVSIQLSFNAVDYGIAFTETGLPSGTSWCVTLNGNTKSSTSTVISFTEQNGAYVFSISAISGYSSSPSNGTLTVSGSNITRVITFTPKVQPSYTVTFTETGLSSGTSWSVTFNGNTKSSVTSTITFTEQNGTYTFTVGSVTGYSVLPTGGSLAVNGSNISSAITFTSSTLKYYSVTFTETGLPSGTTWSVTLNGSTRTSTNGTITFSEINGSYSFTVSSVSGYTVSPYSGTITVSGGNVNRAISYASSTGKGSYTITFSETGLESGTSWSVTLGGITKTSTSTTITFSDSNNTYLFTVGSITGYASTPSSGSITVNGANVNQIIAFSAVKSQSKSYSVTFVESGLPSGTTWSVTLNGVSKSSSSNTIAFNDPNGTYTFTVGSIVNYTVSPQTGHVTVQGSADNQAISFSHSGSGSSGGIPFNMETIAVIGGIIAVIVIAAAVALSRKKAN